MNLKFINYIKLSAEEHLQLLKVRNFDYVRKNMKNDSIITINDHLDWIKKLSKDDSKMYYAIFSDNKLVGGINITDIDIEEMSASWGLFVQANINPMIPSIATYLIIDKVFNVLKLTTLNLEVNKININAYKFDKNFGFIDNGEYIDGKNSYYLMSMDRKDWESNKNKGLLKMVKSKISSATITFKN